MPEGVRRGTLYTSIGLVASGLFLFLFNMIAARTLGPAGFGIWNVLYSMIITVTPLLIGGIRLGIARFVSAFEAKEEKGKIQGTIIDGFTLWICFLVPVLIVTLVLRNSIRVKYLDNNVFLFLVFILSISFYSLLILVRSILQGLREFKYNAITIVVQHSLMVLCLLGFVILMKFGINGASFSFFVAVLISSITASLICFTLKDRLVGGKRKGNLKKFFNFAGPVTLSNFLMVFLLRCGPLLIKTLGGIEANESSGLFASVFALVGVVRLGVGALSSALFPNLSRAEALGNTRLQKNYINKSVLSISGLCFLMIIVFWWFGPIIVKIVYGREFTLERLDMLLIAAMGGFFFLAQLLNNILLAKSLTKEVLFSWSIAAFLLILSVSFAEIEVLLRVEVGLCAANFVAFVLMLGALKVKGFSYSK